eukprot:85570-Prymnesium_polylepis.1
MCPLLCLSVVRTILLIVYDYDSLLATVKSQKSDCGRRYTPHSGSSPCPQDPTPLQVAGRGGYPGLRTGAS